MHFQLYSKKLKHLAQKQHHEGKFKSVIKTHFLVFSQ